MIDLETLSTSNNKPVIVEAGVVVFNKDKILYSDNTVIDINKQIERGGVINGDTLEWWFKDKDRRTSLIDKITEKYDRSEHILWVLDNISTQINNYEPEFIWSNSPTFDLAILRSWYQEYGDKVDWSYRQERDFRTLNQEFFETGIIPKPKLSKKIKYTHNALDDAIYQTKFVQEFLKWSELYRSDGLVKEAIKEMNKIPVYNPK